VAYLQTVRRRFFYQKLALAQRAGLQSTKTRVDQAFLEQEPVSIRHRRVRPPLLRGWGPKARRLLSGREIRCVTLAHAKAMASD